MTFSHLYSSQLDQELGTDDSTRLFTTARRRAAVNEGHLQFADLTECALRQSTVSCSNAVGEYSLISTVNVPGGDYLRLSAQGPEFHLISSGGASSNSTTTIAGDDFPRREIPWLNQYEPGWRLSTGGTPRSYYERTDGGARFFGLVPAPRIGSSETGKVLLPYVSRPATMSADSDEPFTFSGIVRTDLTPYHPAIAHYAAYELEKLRLNTEASQAQLAVFMGYVERFARMKQPKGLQTVRLARPYFRDARGRAGDDEQQIPYPWRF